VGICHRYLLDTGNRWKGYPSYLNDSREGREALWGKEMTRKEGGIGGGKPGDMPNPIYTLMGRIGNGTSTALTSHQVFFFKGGEGVKRVHRSF